jgi:hypothetical protein
MSILNRLGMGDEPKAEAGASQQTPATDAVPQVGCKPYSFDQLPFSICEVPAKASRFGVTLGKMFVR